MSMPFEKRHRRNIAVCYEEKRVWHLESYRLGASSESRVKMATYSFGVSLADSIIPVACNPLGSSSWSFTTPLSVRANRKFASDIESAQKLPWFLALEVYVPANACSAQGACARQTLISPLCNCPAPSATNLPATDNEPSASVPLTRKL